MLHTLKSHTSPTGVEEQVTPLEEASRRALALHGAFQPKVEQQRKYGPSGRQ